VCATGIGFTEHMTYQEGYIPLVIVRTLLGCGLFHESTHPPMPQLGLQSASEHGMVSLALLSEQLRPPLDPYVQGHVGTLGRGAPRRA
jgi:hypothetical protein